MKKTLIITAIALATTTGMTMNASARGPHSGSPDCPAIGVMWDGHDYDGHGYRWDDHGYHRGDGMMGSLNLTDSQRAQIRDIMAQQRDETHAKIRAILTPEQQTVFDTRMQQRKAWLEQRQNRQYP